MKRAAIYARFSSDLQSDRSIDDQVAVCRGKAARDGLAVVSVFEDRAKSGASVHGRGGVAAMMAAARVSAFDVLIVESLDRVSRDQEDLAGIFKKLTFGGIEILSVHDGVADQMQIGIRGIVSALFLTDLANKVRRGAAGNIRAGKHAGGLAYGYRATPGRPGEWVIHSDEAETIRRVFAQYLSGARSREIIEGLNRDGIRPPRGSYWQPGALTGSNNRHNGILGNEIYCGRLVWNRVRMVKDPATGKRVSRPNLEQDWHRADVPHLAIVNPETFDAVAHIRRERAPLAPAYRRKPKRVLSGLLRCGVCGGGMSIKGQDRGGTRIICTQFHNARLCANNRTFYLDEIERIVLDGLRRHLLDPEAIRLFLRTYHDDRKRLAASAATTLPRLQTKLGELIRKIGRLTDAMIASDAPVTTFTAQIAPLESERIAVAAEIAQLSEAVPVVALHPGAHKRYLEMVESLAKTIADSPAPDEMTEAVRELIETVVVERTVAGEPIRLRVNGRLAALIGAPAFPHGSMSGVKMVAGEGLEPPTPGL